MGPCIGPPGPGTGDGPVHKTLPHQPPSRLRSRVRPTSQPLVHGQLWGPGLGVWPSPGEDPEGGERGDCQPPGCPLCPTLCLGDREVHPSRKFFCIFQKFQEIGYFIFDD